jgi:hypothetical protein
VPVTGTNHGGDVRTRRPFGGTGGDVMLTGSTNAVSSVGRTAMLPTFLMGAGPMRGDDRETGFVVHQRGYSTQALPSVRMSRSRAGPIPLTRMRSLTERNLCTVRRLTISCARTTPM